MRWLQVRIFTLVLITLLVALCIFVQLGSLNAQSFQNEVYIQVKTIHPTTSRSGDGPAHRTHTPTQSLAESVDMLNNVTYKSPGSTVHSVTTVTEAYKTDGNDYRHDDGTTTVLRVKKDELAGVIEIV